MVGGFKGAGWAEGAGLLVAFRASGRLLCEALSTVGFDVQLPIVWSRPTGGFAAAYLSGWLRCGLQCVHVLIGLSSFSWLVRWGSWIGYDGDAVLDDMWEFDGMNWVKVRYRSPRSAPATANPENYVMPGRTGHSACMWMHSRHKVPCFYFFGGDLTG